MYIHQLSPQLWSVTISGTESAHSSSSKYCHALVIIEHE
jgi:hypothetical protein